jgi:quercetin dioxygenase-like cupin family protein
MRLTLSLYEHLGGVEAASDSLVVYDVSQNRASFGAASVQGHALEWRLERDGGSGALLTHEVSLDPAQEWLVRCDRVDFPPGGVAYLHTHPGPGIRYLLGGSLEVHTAGQSVVYEPGRAWFESGPEPVLALASKEQETAFVRVLLLPREWEGRRTIRYLDLADEAKPKLQRATVFVERAIAL